MALTRSGLRRVARSCLTCWVVVKRTRGEEASNQERGGINRGPSTAGGAELAWLAGWFLLGVSGPGPSGFSFMHTQESGIPLDLSAKGGVKNCLFVLREGSVLPQAAASRSV